MYYSKNFIQRTKEYSTYEKHIPSPYLRRVFHLDETPSVAEITICGLGFYELYINGKNITKGRLAPYISNPDEILYYDTYRVENLLQKGENVVAVLLGNGFLNQPAAHIWDFDKAVFRDAPKMACALEVNGKLFFEADENFKTADSPILFDDIRAGERYDARNEIEGWNEVAFDDSGWDNAIKAITPKGICKQADCEPIVIKEEVKPIDIIENEKGYVYVFPYNNSGVCRLTIRGKKGQEIRLTHGEAMLGNMLNMCTMTFYHPEIGTRDGYIQMDSYICKGEGEEVYIPRFTYHGFQYVLVEGITKEQATPNLLTYLVMSSNLKRIGSFSCSSETVNTLQENTCRSTISNFFYFPTDCPHREKNGWTADAALSAEQMLLNYSAGKSLKEWLNNAREVQRADGALPGIVPTAGWGFEWGNGPAWDTFLMQIPYYVYKYEQDEEILRDNFDAMCKNLRYNRSKMNENGLLAHGLGDWCPPNRGGDDYTTELQITDTLITIDSCYKMIKIAEILGKEEEKKEIEEYSALLRKNFREYYIKDGRMKDEHAGQAGVAMALCYKVFEKEEEETAVKQLIELIEKTNGCFDVGVLGARVLFRVLSDFGHAELAYKLITQDKFPSYAYMLRYGATTLWENYQELYEDRMVCKNERKLDSLNHHFWGDISAWFYKYIAGIRINPALKDSNLVEIDPCFIKDIDFCHAEREYKGGKIVVDWKRTKDGIDLSVTAPEGITVINKAKNVL